jgi:hypothetical protein
LKTFSSLLTSEAGSGCIERSKHIVRRLFPEFVGGHSLSAPFVFRKEAGCSVARPVEPPLKPFAMSFNRESVTLERGFKRVTKNRCELTERQRDSRPIPLVTLPYRWPTVCANRNKRDPGRGGQCRSADLGHARRSQPVSGYQRDAAMIELIRKLRQRIPAASSPLASYNTKPK